MQDRTSAPARSEGIEQDLSTPGALAGLAWNPVLPGVKVPERKNRFGFRRVDSGPLPANEDDIAGSPAAISPGSTGTSGNCAA